MFFLDAKTVPGRLLAGSVREARLVWRHVARVSGLRAASVQDDHLHVAAEGEGADRELWRLLEVLHVAVNRARLERGPLWDPKKTSVAPSSGRLHRQRKVRYCSLNPCRAGHRYVEDPLEWPWSTHRDLVGLTLEPVVAPHPRREAFHGYCTRDSELRLVDSRLPRDPGPGKVEGLTFEELLARVASLYRVTPREVLGDARRRRFVLGAARELLDARASKVAREAGVHRSTVLRAPEPPPEQLAIVRAVARDPRFYPWTEELYRARVLERGLQRRGGRGGVVPIQGLP